MRNRRVPGMIRARLLVRIVYHTDGVGWAVACTEQNFIFGPAGRARHPPKLASWLARSLAPPGKISNGLDAVPTEQSLQ
jgi:hypothetical protein